MMRAAVIGKGRPRDRWMPHSVRIPLASLAALLIACPCGRSAPEQQGGTVAAVDPVIDVSRPLGSDQGKH